MFIVSKFHDYYDTAIGYGIDKECVYKRNTEKVELLKTGESFDNLEKICNNKKYDYRNRKYYSYVIENYILGFCGKLYPFVKIIYENDTYFIYDNDEFIDFAENELNLKISKSSYKYYWRRFDNMNNLNEIREFFDLNTWKYLERYFNKYKTPIFLYRENYILELNPCLKDLKFMKIKDAFTAFQDIYMYKAGVLGNTEKNTVNIDDKDRIKQRGFDKWSFRKHPDQDKKV